MGDFGFTMQINKASPKLLLACANGSHIKSGLLTCRKAGKEQQAYLKIKFTDLLVSSYETGGNASDTVIPVDSFSINFAKIEYEYAPQKSDGTLGTKVPVHWDLKTNKGG
jgi:type VI secretion system secreted protein Hcp